MSAILSTGKVNEYVDPQARRALMAGVYGTVVEWYDYAIYGFLATTISTQFFAKADPNTALLAAFAVFGLGFVARPLGGILIGRMGDKKGRKEALVVTLIMMAISTMGIGLLPTYDSVGILAPILLVICRLVQGFSAGGEWGSSTTFIVEWAPRKKRGLYGSLQQSSVAAGLLLGSGVAATITTILTPEQMSDWGWRVPFIIGGLLLPLGLYIRRSVDETPAYSRAAARPNVTTGKPQTPYRTAAQAFGMTIFWTVGFYLVLTYMPTFTQKYAGLTKAQSLWANTIGLFIIVAAIPVAGMLSDRIGRKPLLLVSAVSFLVLSYPMLQFTLGQTPFWAIVGVQASFAVMLAIFSGPGPAAIAEIFPTRGRATWMSSAYSLAVAIFGGFAPFIATWLIEQTGTPLAPAFYLMVAAAVSSIVILTIRETAHSDLD